MPIKCLVNGVDRSAYFKPPFSAAAGGDGAIGSTTLHFDQEAGGLDLRPMDLIQVFETFNAAGAGIAPKGRLFGGHVSKRATRNIGTTKLWDLPCWDFSIILKKSYRRAQPVHAVTLSADTLDDQIAALFGILQGASPDIQIDAVSGIALTTAMPGVTYPGGHTWEWYLQQLLITAHIEDPAVFPAYYMGVTNTFGVGDTFGNPVLWVYDAANPPASSVAFSDTPSGAEKSVFEYLTRDTDATALAQLQQSHWGAQYFTATDNVSQAAYPNPYIDEGGGSGYWTDGEVIQDSTSASVDEAQAAVDRIVLAKGAPRDSFKWVTYERLLPGEYVDLEWALEGIPPGTKMRVVSARYDLEEPDVIKSTLTINTRRMGMFDDGTEGWYAPPVEGDTDPPLPPADFDLVSNVFSTALRAAVLSFDIDPSPSPDASGYRIRGEVGGLFYDQDVLTNLTPSITLPPGVAYSLRSYAYDNATNLSDPFPAITDPALTGTTAVHTAPGAPTVLQVATGVDSSGPYAKVKVSHAGDHSGGGRVFAARTTGGFVDAPIVGEDIPPNWTSPIWVTVRDVALSVSYDFSATVRDALGVENTVASNTVTAVIKPAPGGDGPYDTGWDHYSVDADPDVRDIDHEATNGGSFAFDPAELYDGQASLEITVTGLGQESLLLPDRFPAHEGDRITARAAVLGSLFTDAGLKVVPFDATDSELPRETIFSGATSTTFTEVEDKSGPMPATTEYVRVAVSADNSGAGTVHWSRPRLTKEVGLEIRDAAIDSARLADDAVGTAHIQDDAITDVKIRDDAVTSGKILNDAVTDAKLAVLTDTTKHAYDIQTNPLFLYDNATNFIAQIRYNAGSDEFEISSVNPFTTTGLRLRAGASFDFLINQSGVAINEGTPIAKYLSNSATLNWGSIAAHTTSELTVTVTGAAAGDLAIASPSGSPESGLVWSAFPGTNIVTIRLLNGTASPIDPASRDWCASVFKH